MKMEVRFVLRSYKQFNNTIEGLMGQFGGSLKNIKRNKKSKHNNELKGIPIPEHWGKT
ncbi:MAG: hypothetical protein ACTSYF_07060 [Promethearchaeota archaeon]